MNQQLVARSYIHKEESETGIALEYFVRPLAGGSCEIGIVETFPRKSQVWEEVNLKEEQAVLLADKLAAGFVFPDHLKDIVLDWKEESLV